MSATGPPTVLADALRDRYVLERELGRGGMATVYLARDLKHDRLVALKVLHPELTAILGAERFLREIRLTANLQHPHILSLIDSGEAAGQFYYVMPYVEGESLRQRLQRDGQLSLAEAVRLTTEVAEALDYAHQQGIIHRDIKPENILLTRGHALVADFGIALAVTQAGGGRLTETGLSLGTPAYMSPEQATAEPRLDGRTDQYSLACVVYEMLAGEPPYTGPTAQAIMAKRLREPVPHLGSVREVPPSVDQALTRALAKAPADRFASVGSFAEALERPWAPSRYRPTRGVAVFLGGAAVLGLALVGVRALRPRAPTITTHRQITFSGVASEPAVSADHQWLAYVSGDRLLVEDLRSTAPAASVASLERAFSPPQWSTDGSRLFYQGADSASGTAWVYSVPRQGGAARRLVPSYGFDLSPLGDALFTTYENDSVIVFDATTGVRQRGFSLGGVASSIHSLAVSPDGRWLAFTGVQGSTTFLGVSLTDGSKARRLVEGVPRQGTIAWTRANDAIYYLRDLGNGANVSAAGDVMKLRLDPRTGAPEGEPTTVLGGAFVQDFALSADGRTLAYTKAPPQQKIWAMILQGSFSRLTVSARELTTGTSIHGTPDISPDGHWVAFARNDGGNGNLYLTRFDSYEPRPVATSGADEWSPRWSPDGRWIAYAVRDAQSPGILVTEVGSDRVRRVSSDGLAPLGVIAWTPDNRRVVFPLDLGRHYAVVDVSNGGMDTLSAPDSVLGFHLTVIAPDGDHLVVNAVPRQGAVVQDELWLGDLRGRLWSRTDAPKGRGVWPLLWTRDGWIYFLRDDNWLWRIGAGGGHATRLDTLPQPCSGWQTALSADARHLVCTVSRAEPDIWIAENFDPEAQR